MTGPFFVVWRVYSEFKRLGFYTSEIKITVIPGRRSRDCCRCLQGDAVLRKDAGILQDKGRANGDVKKIHSEFIVMGLQIYPDIVK